MDAMMKLVKKIGLEKAMIIGFFMKGDCITVKQIIRSYKRFIAIIIMN